MRNVVFVALAVLSTLACGPAALPLATEKKVVPADIVGTWQYTADYGRIPITLEMRADGTFTQTVVRSNDKLVHSGAWALDGSKLQLAVLYPPFGDDPNKDWESRGGGWWVVESSQEGVAFAIFGGADPDPDQWDEFRRVR